MSKWLSQLVDKHNTYLGTNAPKIFESTLYPPSPSFNYAIGGRGFVYGRAPLFYGVKSSGKSLMALMLIARMQKDFPEGEAIYISTEYDFPEERAVNMGVDLSRVLIRETNTPSRIFDWIEKDVGDLCDKGAPIKIVVVDTIGAIRGPKEIGAKSSEDFQIGDLSSYLQKGLNLIVETIRNHSILFIMVQQARENSIRIGAKTIMRYKFNGGESLKHFADYVCLFEKVNRQESRIVDESKMMFNDKFEPIGHRVKVNIEKNRLGPPDRVGEFDILYRSGVTNQHVEIGQMAIDHGVVERPNNMTYQLGDIKWKGKNSFYKAIEEDDKLKIKLFKKVMSNA